MSKKKKKDWWYDNQVYKIGWGIIIGIILMGTLLTVANRYYQRIFIRDYECFPKSVEDKVSFHYLNQSHCEGDKFSICWIYKNETLDIDKAYLSTTQDDWKYKLIFVYTS